MRVIRRFFNSIHNLIRWLPVIWKDKDWDFVYLYVIMLTKIRYMRQRNEKIKFYEGYRIDAKWMRICEELLTNLVDGVYWEDKYDNKPLNFRNLDATPKEIELAQERICETDDGFFHKGEDLGAGHRADLRERKAKKLLFKILEWRVEYWWD